MEKFLIQDSVFDALPTEQLQQLCEKSSLDNKTRACAALARRVQQQPDLLPYLLTMIRSPANRQIRVMGTISLAHVGFASLWFKSTDSIKQIMQEVLSEWPEPDRSDLVWFLQSQRLDHS